MSDHDLSRRQAIAALAAVAAAPAAAPHPEPPVIDAHQHLWDLRRLHLAWVPRTGPLAGSHLLADYQREAIGLGIVGSVYMEVDAPPDQHVLEAEYALGLCAQPGSGLLGAVIGGRPAAPGFPAYLDRFRNRPAVKGLRQVLHSAATPRGFCLQPDFLRGIRELGKRHLVFDICIPADALEDAARLCELCRDTAFVLDHCGNADVQATDLSGWKRGIDAVARQPNAACKISGIVASARPGAWKAADLAPIVRHCAEAFGPDRIVWASDWPVCTLRASLREWLTAARQIVADWPADDRRKLFHDNAIRIYNLKPTRQEKPRP